MGKLSYDQETTSQKESHDDYSDSDGDSSGKVSSKNTNVSAKEGGKVMNRRQGNYSDTDRG